MEPRAFTFIFQLLIIIKQICKKHQTARFIHYASHKFLGDELHSYFDKGISLAFHMPLAIHFCPFLVL